MILFTHPFNDLYGRPSIEPATTKIILGSFSAFQVTNNLNPRLNFYYGSTDNKFWDLFKQVKNKDLNLSTSSILTFLQQNGYGIVDIVRTCYRKNDNYSSDEDLSILELEDMIGIMSANNIHTIISTSKFVTSLFKKQFISLLNPNQRIFNVVQVAAYFL